MSSKLNKYEKKIMFNLHIITALTVIAVVLNLLLPYIENGKLTIFLISQLIPVFGIYVFGWVNSRNAQNIPIVITFITRTLQGLIFIYWRETLSWETFRILLFFDILFLVILVLDKSNYKYEFVAKEDDEFNV